MKWASFSLVFYMLGLLVFYHIADFSQTDWKNAYYLWDKSKDLILISAIYFLTKRQRSVLVIVMFSAIRFVWELIADISKLDINNTIAINWLFILCLVAWILVMIKEKK